MFYTNSLQIQLTFYLATLLVIYAPSYFTHLCLNISSSYQIFLGKINTLKQIFKHNRHPIHLIDRGANKFLQTFYLTEFNKDTANKKSYL